MTLLNALLKGRDPESNSLNTFQLAWERAQDYPGSYDDLMGVRVTRETALGVSAVWACVSLISDSIASLPLKVYNMSGSAPEVAKTQPTWLDQPNPEQTGVDFKFGCVASLLLDGNAFVYLVRDAKLNILEAWLLDPRWVYVRREFRPDGSLGLNYYVMVAKGMQSPVGPFKVAAGPDMFHIMAFQPNSSWPMGVSPLEQARQMFGSGIAGQEMGARWFGHGFNAAGVIQVPEDMEPDQARQLKQDFKDANGGLRKMHLPPVLTGGATWQQIQITPEQAQFLEQRQFSVDEIARFFRVPPHMIGNLEKSTAWGTGIEEQSIGFTRFTLRPWVERLEAAFTRHMLTFEPGNRFRFDVRALERGNALNQSEFYMKMFGTGAMTPNQIASELGLPTFDGGDDHYYYVNTAPIGTEPIRVNKVVTDVAAGAPPEFQDVPQNIGKGGPLDQQANQEGSSK